ncbi:hypothetical protein DRQ07_02715 [candidate division KSB1 bacterium]|nr:MAG: hypothetical protein DRQ07_02715 [candidate division KSB1 bacterium]
MSDPQKQKKQEFTKEEMEEFIREKETIKQIVGQVGGQPTTFSKVFNVAMMVLILASLIAAPFLPKDLELPAVEFGLVILSIKIFYLLHNEAKVIHFQFWMLSSLEWRMNDTAKRLSRIDEDIHEIAEQIRKNTK